MNEDKDNSEYSKSKIWSDSRFAHLVNDPRFKQLPKSERKVKIDKRFESMFHDTKFKVKYSIDKYGRKINKTSSEDLKKFYDVGSSDEDDEEKERLKEEKEIVKHQIENDELDDDGVILSSNIKDKLLNSNVDYARGEGRLLTDSSSDEETSEDNDDDVYIEHVWGELDNDAPMTEESTRRLAACNMDWDRIRAADIMVLCHSFLPPGGSILSVKIYPSDFGKERMAEEEVHGPPELIKTKKDESDSDSDLLKEEDSDVEEGDDYHMEKLRQYQLNRLKYYYAVIECDSVSTADKLYKECDGLEYESTATKLDLRFIPDDVKFDDEPREVCVELPDLSKYKPRLFTTTALQQAKVELTWDETSVERKELGEKLLSGNIADINDIDLKKYVACSSEDEDEDNNEEKQLNTEISEEEGEDMSRDSIAKYKSLLEEINKKEEEANKSKYEMEYSWGINVDQKPKEKSEKKDLTPIEKILEKRKEKNKKRKEERKKKIKGSDEDDYSSDDIPDGIDLKDPYFAEEFANGDFKLPNKSKSKKEKKGNASNQNHVKEDEERKEKELELLLDEADTTKQHFSLEKIQQTENESKTKKKKRKLKKSKQEIEASKTEIEDNFEINVNDERFKALYTSHLFNIDPTDSHYKKTKGIETLIQEKLKRRHPKPENSANSEELGGTPDIKIPRKDLESRILVKSLKRKIQSYNR